MKFFVRKSIFFSTFVLYLSIVWIFELFLFKLPSFLSVLVLIYGLRCSYLVSFGSGFESSTLILLEENFKDFRYET
jgi:hypothetical protein